MNKNYNNNNNSSTTSAGIGFCGLLTIAFIVLKLLNIITWSWLWVLAPIWIPTIFWIAVVIIIFIMAK